MDFLQDGQADLSLSDEALFGEDEGVDTERQEQEPPQTEGLDQGPAQRTSLEGDPDGTQGTTEAEQGQMEQEEPLPVTQEVTEEPKTVRQQDNFWQKQYTEVQGAMTRKAQELAAERQKRQQLEEALAQMSSSNPAEREQFLQEFVANPQQALRKVANQTVEQAAKEKVKEILDPIIQANQRALRENAWNDAWVQTARTWGDINQDGETLVRKMVEISQDAGDQDLMFRQPQRIMRLAAMELYGLPKVNDSQVIEAAARTAREEALQELNQKNAAKSGLAVAQQTKQIGEQPMSVEDEIIQGIMAAGGKRIFE
mgnify:CR=1 FL=1